MKIPLTLARLWLLLALSTTALTACGQSTPVAEAPSAAPAAPAATTAAEASSAAPAAPAATTAAEATAAPAAGGSGKALKIGYSTWVGYGAFFIGTEKGFFKEAGVDVEMVKIEDPKARFAALAAGQLDGLVSTLDTMSLYAKPELPLSAVLALDDSKGGDGIISKKAISGVADLKGKTVAFNQGSVSDFYLNYVLQQNGLSVNDIQVVNMKQDDAGAAFVAGQVDAAVTWEPWLSRGKAAPDGKILTDSSQTPGLIVDVLIFRKDVLDARKADLQNVIKGYLKSVDYFKSNQDESVKIMAKNVGGWLEDPKAFADTLTGVQIYDADYNKKFFVGSDAPALKTAQFAIDLWTKQGKIETPLKATDIVDSSLLGS